MSVHITDITGTQIPAGSSKYESYRYQYATTSYEDEDRMSPALLVQPSTKEDIALTIKYAKAQKIAVAIRAGGYQYSGASSTEGPTSS
jgi:FAD/FMN-containing dehydrogenase